VLRRPYSATSVRQRLMLPVSGGCTCTFTPGLRELHPGSVASIPPALPIVGPQCRRPLDVPSGLVRPHYRRFGLTPLAAGPRARRLQVSRSVISHPSWRGSKLPERSSTHRRPRQPTAHALVCFWAAGGPSLQSQHCRPPVICGCRPSFLEHFATVCTNCADSACLSS
jgi:hypothetical protein